MVTSSNPHSQANELTGYSGVFQFAPIGFRLLMVILASTPTLTSTSMSLSSGAPCNPIMTEQELQAQRDKFNSYEYRKAIHQAELARAAAVQYLRDQGKTDEEIEEFLK